MSDSAPTACLIDAHGLIYQVFHAVAPMSAPDGRPTNAVFGFTRDLLHVYEQMRPDYLIVCFDRPEKTFRSDIYAAYKANRSAPPDDLISQFGLIERVVNAMNLPAIALPGFEADDAIATVATAAAARGMEVTVCTHDKDCRQLISDKIRMYNLRKQVYLDRDALQADWGVTPEQVVDFLTLMGDKVDNVPGVAGVGEKTAAKFLQQFGTLDAMIARVDELPKNKVRANFEAAVASGALEVSRRLVTLDRNVPLVWDWDNWGRRDFDHSTLLALFQELGFRSFAARVRDQLKSSGAKKNADILETAGLSPKPPAAPPKAAPARKGADAAPGLFDLPPEPDDALVSASESADADADVGGGFDVGDFAFGALAGKADDWSASYTLVNTADGWRELLAQLQTQSVFAIDLETTSLNAIQAKIAGVALCWTPGEASYVAVRAPLGEPVVPEAEVLAGLKPLLEDPAVGKRNQNIKYDGLVFARHGIVLQGIVGDPMLAHYLLHAGERSHNLDTMTFDAFGHENTKIEELIGKGKNQLTIDQVPSAKVAEYAGEDADAAFRLCDRLEAELETAGLTALYRDAEVPLVPVLIGMEATGIRVDVPFLKRLSGEMDAQLAEMETEIHRLAGRPFNINSPKQLRTILFEEQKLPAQKRTGLTGEASTDQETLERLAALGHELPRKMIEHRQVSKLKGTYVDALPELVEPATGRIHTSFNQTVTSTGRLSSSNPNLQNIPTRTEMGKQIRQAFLPAEGWTLLAVDYSQIELRLLAHYCGDDVLRGAFAERKDIHTAVAAEIFKVPEAEVTSNQRRMAKTVNFGVIYGISAHGLAVRLGIPKDEAATFIDTYFARYPKVLAYQDRLIADARKRGYVPTILGRRRRFDPTALRPRSTYQSRNQAEREAINMEIQGSAADLMKLAMIAVDRRMKRERLQARMLLTVHDELVFEAPPAEVEALANLAREEMTGAMTLAVPLEVDAEAGPTWLDTTALPAGGA